MNKILFLFLALGFPPALAGQTAPPIVVPPLPAPVPLPPVPPIPPIPLDPLQFVPIKDIQIHITGTPMLSSGEMLALLQSKTGTTVSAQDLDSDLKALFGTGKIDAVKYDTSVETGGVVLRFEVAFPMKVGNIEFPGVSEDFMRELRPLLSVKVGDLVSSFVRTKEVEAVESFFFSKGYPEAEVLLSSDSMSGDGLFALKFSVIMGPRIQVRRIHLLGNRGFARSDLMPLIDQKENAPRLPVPAFDGAFDRLLNFYVDVGGYLSARIAPPILTETGEEGLFDLYLEIMEGPKYTIDEIAFSGVGRLLASELAELVNLRRGDPYSGTVIGKALSTIKAAYGEIGHIEAEVNVIRTPTSDDKVSVTFAVAESIEFRFGKVTIEENLRTRDAVIRKELQFHRGDVIKISAFKRSMKNLVDLDYFEHVETHFSDTENPKVKDLLITVSEKPTGKVGSRAGYSSLDGLNVSLGLSQGNLDPFDYPNFSGGGVRFSMDMNFAAKGGYLRLSFGRRDFLGRSLQLSLPEVESQPVTPEIGAQPIDDSDITSHSSGGD